MDRGKWVDRGKSYLGDAVSVEVTRGMLRLTVEYGDQVADEIWLEPHVYARLVEYVHAIGGFDHGGTEGSASATGAA
jgi:hypothetical protein